ncbi:hypothetical protein CkaCkLH20_07762 [Colletotrichum karsti]|uniref:Uncharacterized protein n=1 Tax=Colletotrichum karsti TaxID=1095194 RepID=A0A9P6I2J2_9PEZI|nr:uncharacterized protein CkaCkLH20_07762 [Colletotrichum karsti]KAF9874625.1 hypothetical protein CkaCkLH20_07762 [Colletotrichum karsti]
MSKNPFADPPAEVGSSAPDVAPPAYTPHDAVASSSSSAPRPEPQAPREPFHMSDSTSPYLPFPPSLNVYYQWKFTRTFHLGDSANHKLYALSAWGEIGSKGPGIPCIMLHNGPGAEDPALAVCCEEKNWTFRSRSIDGVMVLPSVDAPSKERGTETITELLRSETSSRQTGVSFGYSIEVAQPGGGLRREDFEWRRIQDKEKLDGYSNGFELFRAKPGQGGEPDDEVLAVVLFKGMLNVNKPLNFEFKGRSLSGELGDRWAVMAIMTGIRIWFLFFSSRTK